MSVPDCPYQPSVRRIERLSRIAILLWLLLVPPPAAWLVWEFVVSPALPYEDHYADPVPVDLLGRPVLRVGAAPFGVRWETRIRRRCFEIEYRRHAQRMDGTLDIAPEDWPNLERHNGTFRYEQAPDGRTFTRVWQFPTWAPSGLYRGWVTVSASCSIAIRTLEDSPSFVIYLQNDNRGSLQR